MDVSTLKMASLVETRLYRVWVEAVFYYLQTIFIPNPDAINGRLYVCMNNPWKTK